jgi:hypothetical protein
MGELVPTQEKPLFSKKHELSKLVRDLKKLSTKALSVLEKGLDSPDERVRMIAAEKLLKFYTDGAESIRADEIKSLLLDIRAGGLIGKGSAADDDDDTPALDFENINPEFATDVTDAKNVVDMGNVNKI